MRVLARKKKKEESKGAPEWMTTFSDLMNLLLTFFVLLFSMSSVDAEKWEQLVVSFSSNYGIFEGGSIGIGDGTMISSGVSQLQNIGDYFNDMGNNNVTNNQPDGGDIKDPMESPQPDSTKNPLETKEGQQAVEEYKEQLKEQQQQVTEEMYEKVVGLVERNNLDQYVSVGIDKDYQYIKLSMYGAILFDSGKADIKNEALPILKKIGSVLKVYGDNLIKIEGHTDNVPISSNVKFKSNMELSTARACAVWEYMTEVIGLNAKTLESAGRSEYDPVADNSTEEGRKKNRRVEFKIYSDLDQ